MSANSPNRPAKLQRLNQLRRSVPHVSKSALEAIIADVKEHGVPDVSGRKDMLVATRSELHQINAYGPLLHVEHIVTKVGGTEPILMVNTLSYLHQAFWQGGSFTQLLLEHTRDAMVPDSVR